MRSAWLAVVVVAGGLLTGCSPPATVASTAGEQVGIPSDEPRTEFGRQVLEDGVVTRDEYEGSVDALLRCGSDRGQEFTAERKHGLYVFSAEGAAGDEAFQACMAEDIRTIQAEFHEQYTDPQGRGEVVVAECLVRDGSLPSDYTYESSSFARDIEERLRDPEEGGAFSQEYEKCSYNPQGHPFP